MTDWKVGDIAIATGRVSSRADYDTPYRKVSSYQTRDTVVLVLGTSVRKAGRIVSSYEATEKEKEGLYEVTTIPVIICQKVHPANGRYSPPFAVEPQDIRPHNPETDEPIFTPPNGIGNLFWIRAQVISEVNDDTKERPKRVLRVDHFDKRLLAIKLGHSVRKEGEIVRSYTIPGDYWLEEGPEQVEGYLNVTKSHTVWMMQPVSGTRYRTAVPTLPEDVIDQ